MPEAYSRPEPSLLPIERPRCPACQGRMMLARIDLVLTVPISEPSNARSASVSKNCWSRTHCGQPIQAGWQVGLGRRSSTESIVGLAKRPWTEEDNARLKVFVAQGASIIRAAAALHRNVKSVRTQARKLGEPFPPMRVFRKKLADVLSSSRRHR
jgi:hypothetical protein